MRIPAKLAAQLAQLAEAAWPEEACALLVGHNDTITEIVPAPNVAVDKRAGFEIDPAVQFALRRRLREQPRDGLLLGHWHSHPNGRAVPSAMDAAMIYEPGLLWLISAVQAGRADMPAAFRPQPQGGFASVDLQIEEA
ncbi:M67 family metallopeptidase [Ferrovibrio sp.]|uniref:M67 family metallopeptidase n=1 Tax=Ferrovibrio sp. TaxID=1917215 RepID=UPI0025C0AE89|nr:M67 family metallopeptidase [Ferrovibrio sp.]MBX3455653.1 M67 family metallopeptidase [Ferrovibrio sp.]